MIVCLHVTDSIIAFQAFTWSGPKSPDPSSVCQYHRQCTIYANTESNWWFGTERICHARLIHRCVRLSIDSRVVGLVRLPQCVDYWANQGSIRCKLHWNPCSRSWDTRTLLETTWHTANVPLFLLKISQKYFRVQVFFKLRNSSTTLPIGMQQKPVSSQFIGEFHGSYFKTLKSTIKNHPESLYTGRVNQYESMNSLLHWICFFDWCYNLSFIFHEVAGGPSTEV